jgi:hypothetical protein
VVQAAPPKSTETEERADPWRNIFLVFLGLALGLAAGYMLATMGKPSVAQTSTAPAVAICPPVDTGMAERLNTATLELGTLRANNLTLNTTNATLTERLKSCESPVAKKDVTIAERKPDVRNPNPRKSDQPSSRKDEGKNEPVPSTGYWYWRENTATAEKPGKCIFSGGTGIGKPPFCASFTIVVPKDKESKTEWIGRVGNGRVALDQTIWQKKD